MKNANRVYLTALDQPQLLGELSYFPCDPITSLNVKKLKAFTKIDKVISPKDIDFKQALRIALFTSEAWSHDGFNSNPKKYDALTILKLAEKGASFSCVQFGSVFTQLCQSVGIPARVLQVQTKSPDLGSSGHGHVTAEYFDNQLSKWVWLDPQIHAYAVSKKNIPLSFNELSEMIARNEKPTIKFTGRTLAYLKNDKAGFKMLQNFVRRYIWLSRVGGFKSFYTKQSNIKNIGCKRAGVLPPITFQGFADKSPMYVSREVFDAPLNSCQLQFGTMEPRKKVQWKDLQDYKDHAYLNFATSELKIDLSHSMPWFSHYEVIFNGRRKIVKGDTFKVKLQPGRNTIEVIPVNQAKRAGPVSSATVHFDGKYKSVKNFW